MPKITAWIIAALSLFNAYTLNAYSSPADTCLEYLWTGNDDELFLNINVTEPLDFAEYYSVWSNSIGQGCEIYLLPKNRDGVLLSDGTQIRQITLNVDVFESEDPTVVDYIIESLTELTLADGTTEWHRSTYESSLRNPAIDLDVDPTFFIYVDAPGEGVIAFQNLFPYSLLEN